MSASPSLLVTVLSTNRLLKKIKKRFLHVTYPGNKV